MNRRKPCSRFFTLCLVVVGVMMVDCNLTHAAAGNRRVAKKRRRSHSASPKHAQKTRPTKKSKRSNSTSKRPNGNSHLSNRVQHRYIIFEIDTRTGKATAVKHGISGSTLRSGSKRPQSKRANAQVQELNNSKGRRGNHFRYRARVVEIIPPQPHWSRTARQLVLESEKAAVTKHVEKRGQRPKLNKRPKPYNGSFILDRTRFNN